MLTEQTNPVDRIEVLPDGSLQVREATVILRDGVPITSAAFNRYVLRPGDAAAGKDPRIVAIASAVWTPEVIAARQAADKTARAEFGLNV